MIWIATAAFLFAQPAVAAEPDPSRFVGLPIAGVQLQAPDGGLPEENLDPLLRASQGAPLDLGMVRLDLATLFQVGDSRHT